MITPLPQKLGIQKGFHPPDRADKPRLFWRSSGERRYVPNLSKLPWTTRALGRWPDAGMSSSPANASPPLPDASRTAPGAALLIGVLSGRKGPWLRRMTVRAALVLCGENRGGMAPPENRLGTVQVSEKRLAEIRPAFVQEPSAPSAERKTDLKPCIYGRSNSRKSDEGPCR